MGNSRWGGTGRRGRAGRYGISGYLTVAFTVTALLLLVVLGIETATTYRQDEHDALATLQASAAEQARSLGDQVSGTVGYLQSAIAGPEIADRSRCTPVLAAYSRDINGAPIAMLNDGGATLCATDARLFSPARFGGIASYLAGVVRTGTAVFQPGVPDLLTGKPSLLVVAPIAVNGAPPELLVATMGFSVLFGGPDGSEPAHGTYAVLSPDRSEIYARVPGGAQYSGAPTAHTGLGRPLPGGAATVLDVDGHRRIYREATVPGNGWHVLVGVDRRTALAGAIGALRRGVAFGGLAIIVVTLLGVWLYRRLARPVVRLRADIEAAGRGCSAGADVAGPTEVAAVAEAFNSVFSDRKALEAKLSHQALHDPLTGLPNRALLDDRLRRALASGRSIAVCFLDLDRFKLINDSHGHPVGDQLLVMLAERLRAAVVSGDTVARFGGDEFVVLGRGIRDAADAVARGQRVLDVLREPFLLGDDEMWIGGSVGVAVATGLEQAADLIRNADAAMYHAKETDPGTVCLYDERMHRQVVTRLTLEHDLRRALDGQELALHYQPKFDVASGAVIGAEALVRWNFPGRGVIGPNEFIPVAEETGLIVPIGDWVLLEGCRQVVAWRDQPGAPHTVAVNLSARQLARPDLPRTVAAALEATGAKPGELYLEVTETSLLGDALAVAGRLRAIRDLGVRISIDDFGTGYSSLAYLRTLPLDEIKLDRSFITAVADDPLAASVVASVIDLGHALGLVVVAEGVEDEPQLASLRILGCDVAQGFLLGRPQPAAQLVAARRLGAA